MADKRLKIDITAKDKTNAAFRAVQAGLSRVRSAAKAVGISIALTGTALAVMLKKMANSIDETGKLSRQLGVSIRALETFKLAAELGGSSLETFSKASKQLSKNVFDFVERGTGEAKDAFKQLGISSGDLLPIMNDNVAVFALVADSFKRMDNGAVKTATAYKLFGSRAVELLSVFEGGAAAIRETADEAERFGLILTEKQVRAVEHANDEIVRFTSVFKGLAKQLTAEIFPKIGEIATQLREKVLRAIEKSFGSVRGLGKDIADKISEIAKSVSLTLVRAVKSITVGFLKFAQIITAFLIGFITAIQALVSAIRPLADSLKRLQGQGLFSFITGGDEEVDRSTPFGRAFGEFQDKNPSPKQKQIKAQSEIFDSAESALKSVQRGLSSTDDAIEGTIETIDGFFGKITGFIEGFEVMQEKVKNVSNTVENSVKKTNEALGETKKELNAVELAMERVKRGADEAGQIIAQGFENAILSAKSFQEVLKAVLQDLVRLVFRQTITKPLAGFISSGIGNLFGGGGTSVPAKQFGGLISGNKATLVGEAGPELIVPNRSAQVIPNHRLGGGGVTVVQNVTINAGVPQAVRAEVFKMLPFLKSETASGVVSAIGRGGVMARAVGAKA